MESRVRVDETAWKKETGASLKTPRVFLPRPDRLYRREAAMVRIHRRLSEEGRQGRLLIQVHDELVLEAPRDEAEDHAAMVRDEMAAALPLDVPVQVDVAWGDNWLEAKG